mmetsp:Transcript_19688/g.48120  ORF Transcript_19688/g.48120 Transcript_19688/m.48120 type:complete len:80 (-) Transcript_19688:417-656(-)
MKLVHISDSKFSYAAWLETLDPKLAMKFNVLFDEEIPSIEELEAFEPLDFPASEQKDMWRELSILRANGFTIVGAAGET